MIKPIGGYFEWEFPADRGSFPHSEGVLLNSGRHSLEYILRSLDEINRLWIPYYTCDVILQPIEQLGIPYSFYHINENLTLKVDMDLHDGEYLLYTNYFGVMDEYCQLLASRYRNNLILDYAQAFFAPHIPGINTFYSPRKFVGIPDGGIAYANRSIFIELSKDYSYARCAHLLKRHELIPIDGYNDFKENSRQIADSSLSTMSNLTKKMMLSIDYMTIIEKRRENFKFIHSKLADSNELHIPHMESFSCPMVYPYYTKDEALRDRLLAEQIFVATYWPNVLKWVNDSDLEYTLVKNIIPLPIDQRYCNNDMNRIISEILY